MNLKTVIIFTILYILCHVNGAPIETNGSDKRYDDSLEIRTCFDLICPTGTKGCKKREFTEIKDLTRIKVEIECIGPGGSVMKRDTSNKINSYGDHVEVNNYIYRGSQSAEEFKPLTTRLV